MSMTERMPGLELIPPYGGKLINLLAEREEQLDLIRKAKELPSIQISSRSLHDLEMIATGAFSPLDRFMGEKDYHSVLHSMRLSNGTLFPIPVTLPTDTIEGLTPGRDIVLRSHTNEMLAILTLEELYEWDVDAECRLVLGTSDPRHPLVSEMHQWGRYLLSGPMQVLSLPRYNDFPNVRKRPSEVRTLLKTMGKENVIAYQPRHPMHRAHEALTKSAVNEIDASLLIQPVVGTTTFNDTHYYTRGRCYQKLIDNYYDKDTTLLNLLPLAVRMAGPRAGLWHGIINRNYGANHFIIGRDPHGPCKNADGNEFYCSSKVLELFRAYENEIGVSMIPHKEMVYMPGDNRYEASDRITASTNKYIRVSSTKVIEESLFHGKRLPEWFTFPEVADILYEAYPPKTRQGFCIWLTGLPSSGKSAIAECLTPALLAMGRKITFLDGDVVRTHLTKGLGFSKEDRITNILRVGFVASEVVKHDGVAVCALISPYASARGQVRSIIGTDRFIEVFVDTPVEVCEKRDVKGMYTMAKKGKIRGFTGVDDVYEPPVSPELSLITVSTTPETNARQIIDLLIRRGFVSDDRKTISHNVPEQVMRVGNG
jgi:sulfate adenylyltransferase